MPKLILHKFIDGIECRKCSHCNEWKPLSEFYICKSRWDGVNHDCKLCNFIAGQKFRATNSEERLAKRRKKYVEEIKDKPEQKAYVKEYSETHKEEIRKRSKAYKEAHREEIRQKAKEYHECNKVTITEKARLYRQTERGKEVGRIHTIRRRSRKKELPDTLTVSEWKVILQSQNNYCAGCATEFTGLIPPQMDHIIPITKGGSTTKENVQALCEHCNMSKGNRTNWTYPYVREWT